MSGYTTFKLAAAAGVSVHVVRDYVIRGLVRPVRRTPGGYCLFDEQALELVRLLWALFEVGIGVDESAGLCRALDGGHATECVTGLRTRIRVQRKRLVDLGRQLEELAQSDAARQHG